MGSPDPARHLRTVCRPTGDGGIVWNPTFQAFAKYWSFEARLCRPYRAQTKGKVESGVKYLKRNFLVGREFADDVHLDEDLLEWTTTIADQRIHGTTHERPIDRFAAERPHLLPTAHQPAFRLEATYPRVVADDFLSDGRVVRSIRWWGSYQGDATNGFEDGFFFFQQAGVNGDTSGKMLARHDDLD